MYRLIVSLVALLSVYTVFARQADAGQNAKSIIKKAIKAHGVEKVAKYQAQQWKADGMMIMGDMKQKYKAKYIHMEPYNLRFDLEMNLGGMDVTLTAATNGKSAWEQMGPMMREMEAKKSKEFNHVAYSIHVSKLTPLMNKGFELTSLGKSKVNGKTVTGVKVLKKGQREVKLFFDTKTNLLAKSEYRILDEFSGKEVTQEVFFTGYKDHKGVRQFDTLTIKRAGKTFLIEQMSDHRALEKVDLELFANPKLNQQ